MPRATDTLFDRVRTGLATLRGDGNGWLLLTISVAWFLILGLRFTVPALLPAITADFPVSNATAGAAITLLWVTYALMQFPAGALVDRVGERRLLSVSVVGSGLAMAAYAFSPTFVLFLFATAVFGLASGLYGPPRGTALSRFYDEDDGAAFGFVLAAGSVGAAALPPLAVLVTGVLGWRLAIGLSAPAFVLTGVALWWAVPGGRTDTATTRADGGAVGVGALLRGVRRAVTSRKVALAVVGSTLMLFVFQGVSAFFTVYLTDQKGLASGTAGALFGLLFLSGALSQSVGGALADRYGHSTVLAAAAFFGVVPLVALPFADGPLALAGVAALLGVRLSVNPIANAYIVDLLPADVRGTVWGVLRTGFFSVGAFGSTAVGAMADRALFTEAFLLSAALTAAAGVIFLFLPDRDLD